MKKNVRLYFPKQQDQLAMVCVSLPFIDVSPVPHVHGYWTFHTKDGMAVFEDGTTSADLSFKTDVYGHHSINDEFARYFDGTDFGSVVRADLKSFGFDESHIAALLPSGNPVLEREFTTECNGNAIQMVMEKTN